MHPQLLVSPGAPNNSKRYGLLSPRLAVSLSQKLTRLASQLCCGIGSPDKRLYQCLENKAKVLRGLWDLQDTRQMLESNDSLLTKLVRLECGVHFAYEPTLLSGVMQNKTQDAVKSLFDLA